MNTPPLPTKLTTIKPGQHVYVPIPGLTGVPSGYARQAAFEHGDAAYWDLPYAYGFRSYDAQKGA